jgi:hypothetical protein
MPQTKAGTGHGATLLISSTVYTTASPAPAPPSSPTSWLAGSPPTGIPILQIKNPKFPSQKWSYDDISCLSSPTVGAGTVKENLLTMLDLGEFTGEGIFLPSDLGLQSTQAAFLTGLPTAFQVLLAPLPGQTTGNIYQFNGYVGENPLPTGISVDKAILWSVNIKLTSVVTMTVGS